jgi:hypothetical protein
MSGPLRHHQASHRSHVLTQGGPHTVDGMSEISLDRASDDVTAAAHDAAGGQVVYLTEHGQRLAAIVLPTWLPS